jgi:hypothetical protein
MTTVKLEPELDFNRILDAEWWGRHGAPNAELAALQHDHPIWRYEGGVVDPFWLITRHADISAISKDPAQWLNGPRTTLQRRRGAPKQRGCSSEASSAKRAARRRW